MRRSRNTSTSSLISKLGYVGVEKRGKGGDVREGLREEVRGEGDEAYTNVTSLYRMGNSSQEIKTMIMRLKRKQKSKKKTDKTPTTWYPHRPQISKVKSHKNQNKTNINQTKLAKT